MTDDIVTRLRDACKNADEVASVFLTGEAADYIDNLLTQLRIQAEVVNGEGYHTISGGLHLDAADEIERLRVEVALWKKTAKHIRYHHCKPIGCRYCAIYAKEYPNDPVVE